MPHVISDSIPGFYCLVKTPAIGPDLQPYRCTLDPDGYGAGFYFLK
jgi:hypothetical protein